MELQDKVPYKITDPIDVKWIRIFVCTDIYSCKKEFSPWEHSIDIPNFDFNVLFSETVFSNDITQVTEAIRSFKIYAVIKNKNAGRISAQMQNF